MITEVAGDLLGDPADILVNPVNCVGRMGKGLAAQFKQRFPTAFDAYKAACGAGQMRLGRVHVYKVLDGPTIVHFPTKRHWRENSQLHAIELGLADLVSVIGQLQDAGVPVRSMAVPALGVGLGRLPWDEVRAAIYQALSLADIKVRLYAPQS